MPEDQRVFAGVVRNIKLCVAVISMKGFPVRAFCYRAAKKQASHRPQGNGLFFLCQSVVGRDQPKRRQQRPGQHQERLSHVFLRGDDAANVSA